MLAVLLAYLLFDSLYETLYRGGFPAAAFVVYWLTYPLLLGAGVAVATMGARPVRPPWAAAFAACLAGGVAVRLAVDMSAVLFIAALYPQQPQGALPWLAAGASSLVCGALWVLVFALLAGRLTAPEHRGLPPGHAVAKTAALVAALAVLVAATLLQHVLVLPSYGLAAGDPSFTQMVETFVAPSLYQQMASFLGKAAWWLLATACAWRFSKASRPVPPPGLKDSLQEGQGGK
jgi:hypothetical protein